MNYKLFLSKDTSPSIALNDYVNPSKHGNGVYLVCVTMSGWACFCPDNTSNDVKCKHGYAVEFGCHYHYGSYF